jgi:hypothetical protein
MKGQPVGILVPEKEFHERCPSCGLQVIHCGAFIDSMDRSYDEEATYIGDCIDTSFPYPCSRCGTELLYDTQKEWDEGCFVCGSPYQKGVGLVAEWQRQRNCYRWWCPSCDSNFLGMLVAEGSRPLARALWFPLLALTHVVGPVVEFCGNAWFALRCWWERRTESRTSE